jgi:hypothetical protein
MLGGQCNDLVPSGIEKRARTNDQRTSALLRKFAKAGSMSHLLLGSATITCSPLACAAASISLRSPSASRVLKFMRTATVLALGASWRSSSSRFAPNTPEKKTTPVTFAPGRLRLVTSPSLTGSLPVAKTIGVVLLWLWRRALPRC